MIKPDLTIGEAYMKGKLRIDDDGLEAFIHLLMANSKHLESHWAGRLSLFFSDRFAPLANLNQLRASKRNVAHHYDLTDVLFASFLDPHRQYSCSYFAETDTSLDEAQVIKVARLAAKLNLQPGDRVLERLGRYGRANDKMPTRCACHRHHPVGTAIGLCQLVSNDNSI